MKNRKDAGKDGISNGLLKCCGVALREQLTVIINKIIKHSKIPEEWKTSELILLVKQVDKKQPKHQLDKYLSETCK